MENKNIIKPKGLTITVVFEGESLNYGEGLGNVASLKKMSRGNGDAYSYLSRQAICNDIKRVMGANNSPLSLDKEVIQFAQDAKIDEYAEVDLFGYMKTQKPIKTRSAIVRVSNAVSLESFNSDLDFLTNIGLLDRYNLENKDNMKKGGNISQSEIQKSYYSYTVTVDLDKVGIDDNDDIEIPSEEKANRIKALLKAIKFLHRDIKGRRENLSPLFVVGGVYDIKNPFFENRVKMQGEMININPIIDTLNLDNEIKDNTSVGLVEGIFKNNNEIKENLNTVSMGEFFSKLEEKVYNYYNN